MLRIHRAALQGGLQHIQHRYAGVQQCHHIGSAFLREAVPCGVQVEYGVVVRIRRHAVAREQRIQGGTVADVARIQVARGEHVDVAQFPGERRVIEHRRLWRQRDRACRGDDQDVVVAGREHHVVRERLAQRAHHRCEQRRVDLVELEPLHQDAARVQVAANALVELAREQARDAAHPRIRRLGYQDVVAPVARGKEGLCIVDPDPASRIEERRVVARREAARRLGHGGFDFDCLH